MESNDFLRLEGRKAALVLDAKDNVAVALADVNIGESCRIRGCGAEYDLQATEKIPFGHKIALTAITQGNPIFKYGVEIGVARESIMQGAWIHSHNLFCARGM